MKWLQNLKIGKKLYSGFALVLVVLVALSALSFINFSKQSEAARWNEHTYDVLMELDQVLASMVNMETGQRGFALTGVESSLEPFESGKAAFDVHFNKVKQLTSDNPKQQELLSNLFAQKEEWLEIAEASIA